MARPFRFQKAGPRTYTVIATADQAVLGSVDRLSPDHATLSPKWRGIVLDGPDAGSHHRTRDAAAYAILDALAERDTAAAYAAAGDTNARLTTVARVDDVADLAVAQAFYANGWDRLNPGQSYSGRDATAGGWDPLSMEGPHRSTWHLTGYRLVGRTETRAVYVWRFAVNGTSDTRYCAAVVDVQRDPACVIVTHVRDYQPPSEQTRTGAEEKAAAVLAELAAAEQAVQNEPVSAELATELAVDAHAAFVAGRPAAPALSSLVLRNLDGLDVGSTRATAIMQTWADVYDAARDQAAAVLTAGTLWLCGPCYENVTRDLAQCEDGCAQRLDHDGACHPRDHAGNTCTRCGEVDRLTPYDVDNLDADEVRELFVRCPRCRGFHGPAGGCGGPELLTVEELTASAYPPDRDELDASAYGTDRDRRPTLRVRGWLAEAAGAVAAEAWKPQTAQEAEDAHTAFHLRSGLPRPAVLCTRCTPSTRIEPGRGLTADV